MRTRHDLCQIYAGQKWWWVVGTKKKFVYECFAGRTHVALFPLVCVSQPEASRVSLVTTPRGDGVGTGGQFTCSNPWGTGKGMHGSLGLTSHL